MTGAPAVSSPFHELPLSMAAGSLLETTTVSSDIDRIPQSSQTVKVSDGSGGKVKIMIRVASYRLVARNQAQAYLTPPLAQTFRKCTRFVEIGCRYPDVAVTTERFANDRFTDCLAANNSFQRLADDLSRQHIKLSADRRGELDFDVGRRRAERPIRANKHVFGARLDAADDTNGDINTSAQMDQRQRNFR